MRKVMIVSLFAAIFMGCTGAQHKSDPTSEAPGQKSPAVFIHGGAIDDYVSYLLLTTMDNIELRAVIATNTDSIARYAMRAQWKIQQSIKDLQTPIGLSRARGWNPFPWAYRSDSILQPGIKMLAGLKDNPTWPPFPSGDDLLRDLLSGAVEKNSPITILITSPLTTISDLLRKHPGLEKGIARMVWIGGAIHVKGNLDKNTIPAEVANPKAEWNVFFDPHAVDWVFKNTSFPIVLFPLDVTDKAPLTKEFKKKLKKQASSFRYSKLAHQSYGLIANEPFYEMWNTVTTAYLAHPDFFDKPKTMRLKVITEGYHQGALKQSPAGRSIDVVLNISQIDRFYDYVLEQFRRDFKE